MVSVRRWVCVVRAAHSSGVNEPSAPYYNQSPQSPLPRPSTVSDTAGRGGVGGSEARGAGEGVMGGKWAA